MFESRDQPAALEHRSHCKRGTSRGRRNGRFAARLLRGGKWSGSKWQPATQSCRSLERYRRFLFFSDKLERDGSRVFSVLGMAILERTPGPSSPEEPVEKRGVGAPGPGRYLTD